MAALRLSYLPANLAWAFTLGDSLVRFYPQGEAAPLLFTNGPDAVRVARDCGLDVNEDGTISVPEES